MPTASVPPPASAAGGPRAPAKKWHGVRDATEPGAACPQTGLIPPVGPKSNDEDCLFLNVTTPRTAFTKPRPRGHLLKIGSWGPGRRCPVAARRYSEAAAVELEFNTKSLPKPIARRCPSFDEPRPRASLRERWLPSRKSGYSPQGDEAAANSILVTPSV
ncbi:carboxylesterase family protein [Streptomyces sp. NBC_01481]|uniref:carboxylesterase family protein n=1 Tax=Streptomyces sp. NBC_01481 TaxID=2975869 RepID=UPI0022503BD7|nr:carboxylesterase family protein [Streptomyces sp. NBC_01481]MCX4586187.1 carboxylesterase family protein [Streptomyces sp. NBC_01481]